MNSISATPRASVLAQPPTSALARMLRPRRPNVPGLIGTLFTLFIAAICSGPANSDFSQAS